MSSDYSTDCVSDSAYLIQQNFPLDLSQLSLSTAQSDDYCYNNIDYSVAASHYFPSSCFYIDQGFYYDSTSVNGYHNYSYPQEHQSCYIHAPAPTLPFQSTIIQSHSQTLPYDGTSLSEFPADPASQWGPPQPLVHAPQPYEAPLHQNGTSSPPIAVPTPSTRLTEHANNASSKHHECSADPSPPATNTKPALKPGEVRRRRADRRRAKVLNVSSVLSFRATDPDAISSHEKKRFYVGGLEQYVVWMERQIRLAGQEPRRMQNIKSYKGICSRSLRTMLAHVQNEADKLHADLEKAERKFYDLQFTVCQHEEADAASLDGISSVATDSSVSDDG